MKTDIWNDLSFQNYKSRIKEKCLKLFFSKVCVFCGKMIPVEKNAAERFYTEDMKICRHCLANLPLRLPFDQVLENSLDYFSDEMPFHMYAPFFYKQQMITLLHQMKFYDGMFLALPFGFFMAMIVCSYKLEADVILPIPLSRKRQRERGYNQALLLANEMGAWLKKPVISDCLLRIRETKRQSEIEDPIIRKMNVDHAFAVSEFWDVEGLRVFVVDDVFTTGATMLSAAQTLRKAGALDVTGIAVASGRTGQETGIISEPDAYGAHVFEPS